MPWGKHKGKPVQSIPRDYLEWLSLRSGPSAACGNPLTFQHRAPFVLSPSNPQMRTNSLQNIDQHIPILDHAAYPVIDSQPRAERKAALRHVRRVASRRFVRLQQRRRAVEALDPLPGPAEALHGVCDGSYSGWSFAEAIVTLLAEPVEMIVGTLGFNRPNCDSLCQLLDSGKVTSVLLLLVSDYFRSSDRTIFADCSRELESRGQRVAIARSHAKLIMLRTASRSIVCETSANLRSSQNWEQFTIADDAELYDFHAEWIHDLTTEAAQ